MADRVIRDGTDLDGWIKFLRSQSLPMTVSTAKGANRSNAQNRTLHMWYGQIADQRGDTTHEEQRAECKLHFGVPILRRDNVTWREEYDATVMPLPYETKLRLIRILDWPVTRKMTAKQAAEYQDMIWAEYVGQQGYILTDPELQKYGSAA